MWCGNPRLVVSEVIEQGEGVPDYRDLIPTAPHNNTDQHHTDTEISEHLHCDTSTPFSDDGLSPTSHPVHLAMSLLMYLIQCVCNAQSSVHYITYTAVMLLVLHSRERKVGTFYETGIK